MATKLNKREQIIHKTLVESSDPITEAVQWINDLEMHLKLHVDHITELEIVVDELATAVADHNDAGNCKHLKSFLDEELDLDDSSETLEIDSDDSDDESEELDFEIAPVKNKKHQIN